MKEKSYNTRKKAQASMEYLLILCSVLIICLILIGLLADTLSTGTSVSLQQSRGYWKTVLPFSIEEATIQNSTA